MILSKSLRSIDPIQSICLSLKTIDDLFLLLDGLLPNIQTMIIHLLRPNLHGRFYSIENLCSSSVVLSEISSSFSRTFTCEKLINFTLLDHYTELIVENIKSIFSSMKNLENLTLSIRHTNDSIFCQGNQMESLLNHSLPNLKQFHYTVTHRIDSQTFIEDFHRYSMEKVFYSDEENGSSIHIYSLPWPANPSDQRELPKNFNASNIQVGRSMRKIFISKQEELSQLNTLYPSARELTTNLFLNIPIPSKISKLTLTEQTSKARIFYFEEKLNEFV